MWSSSIHRSKLRKKAKESIKTNLLWFHFCSSAPIDPMSIQCTLGPKLTKLYRQTTRIVIIGSGTLEIYTDVKWDLIFQARRAAWSTKRRWVVFKCTMNSCMLSELPLKYLFLWLHFPNHSQLLIDDLKACFGCSLERIDPF